MMYRGHSARHRRPTHVGRPGTPFELWQQLIAALRAVAGGSVQGPGAWEQLAARRTACAGAPIPAEGEAAKSAAMALLELARTWPRCTEAQADWRRDTILLLARECEVLIEQQVAARTGRMMGERD
jgi:hypothetical protein